MTERFNDLMPASWNDDENGELLRRLDAWQEGEAAGPLIRWAAAHLRGGLELPAFLDPPGTDLTLAAQALLDEFELEGGPPDPGKPEGGPYPTRPDPGKVEDYSLSGDDRRIFMRGFLAVFGPLTLVALGVGWAAHYWAPLQGIAALLLILAVVGAWGSLIEWAVSR